MTLEFELGLPDAPAPLDGPIELRWKPYDAEADDDGKSYEVDRDRGRLTGGLLGRLPDEATELIKLLESAMHVRERGAEEIEDVDVRRVCRFDTRRRQGRRPSGALCRRAERCSWSRIATEARIDGDGLIRRIAYEVRLPEQRDRDSGRLILPRHTVRGVYDFSEFGGPL